MEITSIAGLLPLLLLTLVVPIGLGIEFAARNIGVAAIVAWSGLERIDLTFFSGAHSAVGYPLIVSAVIWRRRRESAH